MVFFLKPRNKMTKPKISNRRKQLLELMRMKGRPIIPQQKQFVFNELLMNQFLDSKKNIRRDPVVMTGSDAPLAIVEPVMVAEAGEPAKKAKKTNSDKMTILKRMFDQVENLDFTISSRISKAQMNSMIKFLEKKKAFPIENIYEIKKLKTIDDKLNFLIENIHKINLPQKYESGHEETKEEPKEEPKTPGENKSKVAKTPTSNPTGEKQFSPTRGTRNIQKTSSQKKKKK